MRDAPKYDYRYGTFFKYRAIPADGLPQRDHLRELIVERKMYFARPEELNDPFDCRPHFSFENTSPKELRAVLGAAWNEGRQRNRIPRPDRRTESRHISDVMRRLSQADRRNARFQSVLSDHTGIFCMSDRGDLATQWAYYADNGEGICLRYEVPDDGTFNRVFSVNYTDDRP